MPIIAPSLLSSNFLNLEADCKMLNESQADWYHLDVMDGHFVPNISFGPMLINFFRKATTKICDVHLMIENPGLYAEAFKKAGADILSVHIEACPHLHRNIQQIKSLGMQAGVAINPHTPVEALKDVLAGLKVDKARAQKIVTLLLRDKVLVKISEDLVFHRDALLALRQRMSSEKTKSPKIDVARFKDMTGVTRKYAIPLLEYLDREHVTRRVGDERVIL